MAANANCLQQLATTPFVAVASTRRFACARVANVGQRLSSEHMDFGRTGHGEGERFLPLDGRNLSCCLRPPVIDRWLSSGQKRDGADGSSRQNPSARQFWAPPFVCTKGRI